MTQPQSQPTWTPVDSSSYGDIAQRQQQQQGYYQQQQQQQQRPGQQFDYNYNGNHTAQQQQPQPYAYPPPQSPPFLPPHAQPPSLPDRGHRGGVLPSSALPPPPQPQSQLNQEQGQEPPPPMSREPLLAPGSHAQYAYSAPTPTSQQPSTTSTLDSSSSVAPAPKAYSGAGTGQPGHTNGHDHGHGRGAGMMHESEEELTADELEQYESGLLTWDKAKDWRFWFRKEWTLYYIGFVLIIVIVALMAFFHHSIINWLSPFVRELQTIKYGWLIPVGILFVLSFPPLFGNEIVIVLVGIVWGLGVGFAITVVGISLGEIANYFVFRYACRARAHRLTKKSLNYACLTEVVRSGGFWMCFLIRLSAIPTHVSTVLFAVCELPFWKYLLALVAGLPKQLIAVYVGVVLADSSGNTSGKTNSHVISDAVFGVTAVITLGAMWYIYRQMIRVRKRVLIGMRKDLHDRGVDVGRDGEGVLGPAGPDGVDGGPGAK